MKNQLRPRYLSIDVDLPDDPQLQVLNETVFKDWPCRAFGFWTMLLLTVARFGHDGKLRRSDDALLCFAKKNAISCTQVDEALKAFYERGLIDRRHWAKWQIVYIPGVAERLDPYFRRQTTEKPPMVSSTKTRSRKEVKEDNIYTADTMKLFEQVWELYPRKLGRKEALRHFAASVHAPADFEAIVAALGRYKADVGKHPREWQHGGTWFNNWQDWRDITESRKPNSTMEDEYTATLRKEREVAITEADARIKAEKLSAFKGDGDAKQ